MTRSLRLAALAACLIGTAVQAAEPLTLDVHRDANCGCCKDWITYLEANGVTVRDHVEPNMGAVKQRLGVAPRLASCHTAVLNGKFIEGHVPLAQIHELQRRPDLLGIAVPGMPAGSPGMDHGPTRHAYQVIGLSQQRTDEVIAEYPGEH